MKISLALALIFIVRNQPIFMIGILMILVLTYSLIIYREVRRFWFGYLLLLILLRGVLVVFSYVVSLIPNERFEFFSLITFLLIFLYLFVQEYIFSIKIDDSLICLLLWEGLILGYIIYLVTFLLTLIIIVIFVSLPQIGALRLLLCAW